MSLYKADLYNNGGLSWGDEYKAIIIDENGNISEANGYIPSSSDDTKDSSNKAKKSKSPNTSDPASIGLGVMAMVSALGGFATLRRKK